MPSRGKMIFITGAARSGKSYYAEKTAAAFGGPVTYIATCIPGDEEMKTRVRLHQERRPASWETIEEASDPARVIQDHDQCGRIFLLDCLTLLVSNWLLAENGQPDEEQILQKISALATASYDAAAHVIIVSNEVGWGIVPGDPLSRMYRDIIGRANQKLAERADEAYLTVAGIPVELKSLAAKMKASNID